MPANAGIQVRFRFRQKNRLDSGFRRNDEIRINSELTNSESSGLEPKIIQLSRHDCVQPSPPDVSRNIRRDLAVEHGEYLLPVPRRRLFVVDVAVRQ